MALGEWLRGIVETRNNNAQAKQAANEVANRNEAMIRQYMATTGLSKEQLYLKRGDPKFPGLDFTPRPLLVRRALRNQP